VDGLVGGLAGAGFALSLLVLNGFATLPTDLTAAISPTMVLRADRSAFRTSVVVAGLPFGFGNGLLTGLQSGFQDGLGKGLAAGFATGLVSGLIIGLVRGFRQTAWGEFALTRAWFATRSRLPWRLMAFLADAHQRGVLRQVGAVYQFRHIELQRRLANR
jgi:hypothetical protein